MKTQCKKEEGTYKTKLYQFIGKDKVKEVLRIYEFIKTMQDEDNHLQSFPLDRLNNIAEELKKLKRSGWLNNPEKIIDMIETQMRTSKSGLALSIEHPERLSLKRMITETLSIKTFIKRPEKKGRKKRTDAITFLLFCLYTLLKKGRCKDVYLILANFIEEYDPPCPGDSTEALRSALRDVKKKNIKEIYQRYYYKSGIAVNTDKGTRFLYNLPLFEDILK